MPKIEEDGKSWLRRAKLYKGDVEPYKERSTDVSSVFGNFRSLPMVKLVFVALNVSRNLFRLEEFKAILKLTLFLKTDLANHPDFFLNW